MPQSTPRAVMSRCRRPCAVAEARPRRAGGSEVMRNRIFVVMIAAAQLMGVAMASPLSAETATFETDAVGGPPRGWLLTKTGRGTPKWTVERDEGAAVLRQSGKATYPVALKEGTNIR